MRVLLILILGAIVIIAASLAEVYASLPLVELKRRARAGDRQASAIYKVAVYQFSFEFTLWLIISLAAVGFFVLLTKSSPIWVALTGSVTLIWLAIAWIPISGLSTISTAVAVALAPYYAKVLQIIHPLFAKRDNMVNKRHTKHTNLFEKADIADLLVRQSQQLDNRVAGVELDMMRHMLTFNDKIIADIMTPKKKAVGVYAEDRLGPVVQDELHKSGANYFPVYENKKATNVVGVLSLNSLNKANGNALVKEVMNHNVAYLHEEQPLSQALQALINTNQQLFIVINSFEDFVGIVSVKDIISELSGPFVIDELDEFENKSWVARNYGHKPKDKLEEIQSEEVKITEVIE